MAKIRLVGGKTGTRSRLPIELKVRVVELVHNGEKAKAAIQIAAAEHGLELKESYLKYAGSHVYRFVQEVGRQAQKNEAVRELCEKAGLQFETEEQVEQIEEQATEE